MDKTKLCTTCKEKKPITDFKVLKNRNHNRCRSCDIASVKKSAIKRRAQWRDFIKKLKGEKCSLCGYDREWKALHLHHIFPKEKKIAIADYTNGQSFSEKNKKIVITELKKTILLCSNCHTEVHSKHQEKNNAIL